ncbi:helix-turn-helix domain protein [Lasius niger]|uniref:Helix-turn-helix domain protein n=1 Tax=Lasius niger TaxID=67767 RepID=A0A0J7MWZ2_LASNI|nr:helix-turn-helix domain protein [Lasius niger]
MGARLIDVSRATGIPRPSTHRLLAELGEAGLICRNSQRRYLPTGALFALGLNAPGPLRDREAVRQVLQVLAQDCGAMVYLAIRVFGGVRYLLRMQGGEQLIRADIANVGDVLPFASTYAGTALMASMDDRAIQRYLHESTQLATDWREPGDWPAARAAVLEAIRAVREQGWCNTPGILPGLLGLAVRVPGPPGGPQLALSTINLEQCLPLSRQQILLPRFVEAAAQVADQLIH